MKSDLMHSRVLHGPEVHVPTGHHTTAGAEEQNLGTAMRRPLVERDILERLVTEVHETVATGVQFSKAKKTSSFGALSLWNLRRNTRSARQAIRQPCIITGLGY